MEIIEITDKNIWEKFLGEYSPQSLFQSWNWGEVIQKVSRRSGISRLDRGSSTPSGHDAVDDSPPAGGSQTASGQSLWRIGIYDEEKLVGIALIQKVIARRGSFLHIRHGPVFSNWKKDYFNYLIDYLKRLNQEEKTLFLRISPLLENSAENKELFKEFGFIDAPMHAMDGEYCWILDIKKSEEELLSGMRKTTRYLVRQAKKLGVEIVKSKNKKDLAEFLTLYEQTSIRHNFAVHKGIMEEFEQFLCDDQILLFKGYYGKKLISAAMIIFYNNQAIYHHSASIGQKVPVNYLLQWEAIKEAKKRKLDIYNFWGIAPYGKNRHPWKGLTIFKLGFGGEIKEYLHAQDLPFSFKYCATYLWESFRKIKKGY